MSYQLVLFIHLLALLAATATSAIVHFAAGRRAAAPTLRAAMEWGKVVGNTARVFPVTVVVLVASGAYMVADRWTWHTGWVQAGFLGAIALLASGAILGKRGAADAQRNVARLQAAGRDLPNDGAPDRVAAVLGEANTGFALGIALVMTVKPGLAGSLGILAIGALGGAVLAVNHLRGAAREAMPARAEAA